MKKISKALILAIQYIESRTDQQTIDYDVAALEMISSELQDCSEKEHAALMNAAADLGSPNLLNDIGL